MSAGSHLFSRTHFLAQAQIASLLFRINKTLQNSVIQVGILKLTFWMNILLSFKGNLCMIGDCALDWILKAQLFLLHN